MRQIGRKIAFGLLLAFCCVLPQMANAQDDAEFRMEIGGGLGTYFYLGDVNSRLYSNSGPSINGVWRYLFDHHNALKVSLDWGKIKGEGTPDKDFFPQDPNSGTVATEPYYHKFSGSVVDLSCMYELNFWPYGYYKDYQNYKRLTPFIQLGLGFTYGTEAKVCSANLPIGLGVKYRLAKRLNLALDWTMHFSFTDRLDNFDSPHGIKSEGLKNKDSYCLTQLTLTYSFAPICVACNKAD